MAARRRKKTTTRRRPPARGTLRIRASELVKAFTQRSPETVIGAYARHLAAALQERRAGGVEYASIHGTAGAGNLVLETNFRQGITFIFFARELEPKFTTERRTVIAGLKRRLNTPRKRSR